MSLPFWRRRSFWVGLAVFGAAAALRVSLIQTARFTGDEANDYAIGLDIAHGVNFPLLGPEITGGQARHPGPLFYWMNALPLLVWQAPEAGYLFFELLGAATVLMFWASLRRPFGEVGAAFAAALMALSPWSALFGDRVWNPHGFLFFEGLALLAAIQVRERPGSAWIAAVPIGCLALPHFHLSAPVVWLALLPLLAGTWRQWNKKALAAGLTVGLALYVPFAIHELQTGFGNVHAFIAETFAHPKAGSARSLGFLYAPVYMIRFLTLDVSYHELTSYWGGPNEAANWRVLWEGSAARPFHPLRLFALLASAALFLTAAVVAARGALARAREAGWARALGPFAAAALVAAAADIALLATTNKPPFAHYITATLPFVFVLYAALAQRAAAWRRGRALVLALGVIFCVGGIEATLSISRRIDGRTGLAAHRAVIGRILADGAQAGRAPDARPVSLSFGYIDGLFDYDVMARRVFHQTLFWGPSADGFAYRLQKIEDPPPAGAEAFPVTRVGPIRIYRLR